MVKLAQFTQHGALNLANAVGRLVRQTKPNFHRGIWRPEDSLFIAKAAVEEGTYPTLKDFTLVTTPTDQQKNWTFKRGRFTIAEGPEADPGFTSDDPATYLEAYNPSGQYIENGDFCLIAATPNGYVVASHRPMSPNVITTLATDTTLNALGAAIDLGTIWAWPGIPSDTALDSGTYVTASLFYTGVWQYKIVSWECQGA